MSEYSAEEVRARFEVHYGISWESIQTMPIGSGSRLHLESHYKRHFETWQAAYAERFEADEGAAAWRWRRHAKDAWHYDQFDSIEDMAAQEMRAKGWDVELLFDRPPAQPAQLWEMKQRACRAHALCNELRLAHPEIPELGDDGVLHEAIHDILRVDTPTASPAQAAQAFALPKSFVDRATSSDESEPQVMGAGHLVQFTTAQVDWLMTFNARLIVNGLHPEDARMWMRATDQWDFDADPVAEADSTWQDFFANPDDDGPFDPTPTAEPVAQGEVVAYFSADPAEGEFSTHKSLAEAIAGAESLLAFAQDVASDDGWADEPPQICYGVVLGGCVEKEGSRRPAPEGSDFAEMVDFRLTNRNACKGCNGKGQARVVAATSPGSFASPPEDHFELDACPDCEGSGTLAAQPRAVPSVLDGDELAEFAKTIAEFNDCEMTETPQHVLMRWAEMGLLVCEQFELTKKGQDLLTAALQEKGNG